MNKKLIRLTESDLHRIVKESVNRIISESDLNKPIDGNLDIPSYEDPNELFSNCEIPNRTEKFNKIMRGYSKMPKGYDRSINPDSDAADRISMMNKSYESEAFPYLKDAENDASWNAYDRELERERNEMEHKYGSGAEDWLYNESVIRRATKESINKILKEARKNRPLSFKEPRITEASSFDIMKYEKISEFRQTDPMDLSDSELEWAIDYMLAYRWALKGDEQVLSDYIEEAKRRGLED